jgi:ribosomal protein L11 methyltransferase
MRRAADADGSPAAEGVDGIGWTTFRVRASADAGARERAIAALFDVGSTGVQEEGDALLTHFPPGFDVERARRVVARACPGAAIEVASLPDVDWTREWRKGVGAHAVGSLVIAPPWLAAEHDPARTIVIDPAMAFGTGEHETTRCVARLMQGVIRAGDRVADLGAGSAVLAIAAAKLGAAWVAAIELDPDAIGNAEENVARNGVADRVRVVQGDAALLLPLVAPVRVVVANIISSVLVELLPVIQRALTSDGQAILSGILLEERASMLQVLEASDWRVGGEDSEGQWWSVSIGRR